MPRTSPIFEPAEKHSTRAPISRLTEICLAFAVTFALLVPCVWQEHIQAGDLSSHVYNAWLATEIKNGDAPGLYIAHPLTNVLCDWLLEALLSRGGARFAERTVCGAAVLVFFWGAFYMITSVTKRRPWLLAPCLAMLAYGLVFTVGFLNFYVSTGICLWIIGLLWNPSRTRVMLSLPLVVFALLAHAMPVVWAGFVILYVTVVRRFPSKMRLIVLAATLTTIVAAQLVVMRTFPYRWSLDQVASFLGVMGLTGTDQFFLSGFKYLIVVVGIGVIWCALFLVRLDQGGMMDDPLVHLWILQMAAYILTPLAIQLPQYQHVFSYIPERLSLFTAVVFCAMVGGARYGRGITRFSALVATIFFTFVFLDGWALNAIERTVTDLAETLPPGQRLVAAITDSNNRLNPLLHVADRVCIGRCFSYADYEPASGQFRVRPYDPNPVVAANMDIVQEMEEGHHVVTAQEAPLYSVCDCGGTLCMRRLEAGETTCGFSLPVSVTLTLPAGNPQ